MSDVEDDILGMYKSNSMGGPRATNGGKQTPKPLPYDPPTGRCGSTNGPGLGGTNYGTCGTQRKG